MPSAVSFTWCLIIVFTMFVGEGNGKWKSKNRKHLQEDIAKFKEMAEKIEDEIEDFYDEYSDSWPKDENIASEADYPEKINSQKVDSVNDDGKKLDVFNSVGNDTNNITENDIPRVPASSFTEKGTPKIDTIKQMVSNEKANVIGAKWPKFEDILLDIGKKYDWKNDRWIKVKKKVNQSSEDNHLIFHERHKFSYKTVKLNSSKSRRNVVIAVTAVR